MSTQTTPKKKKTFWLIASWLALPFLFMMGPFVAAFLLFDWIRPKWEDE